MEISDDKIGETILQEALKCLYQTIEEGEKTSDVDIEAMLTNVERSRQLLQKKLEVEIIPFYKDILLQLVETLSSHEEVLKTKIKQLNLCNIDASGDACFGKTMCHKVDPQLTGRRAAIEETIVRENGLGMSDIAGLLEAKQALREAIIMPLQFPNLFTGGIQPWRRILLYGPPGTGKSRLAQALSSEIKSSSFYCVSSSDLVSSWVGESEKLIKELFSHATQQQSRSVIFIDEIDSICRQRTSREEEYTRRIKTELLRQMEGADNEGKSGKIFLLCATNCPWELDSAFLRRFQKRIYVPLPDLEARLELLKIHTRENGIIFSEDNWLALGHATEGFSGSDLANMILDALMQPIRELHHTTCWKQTDAGMFEACKADTVGSFNKTMNELPVEKIKPRKITLEDFLISSKSHRKTVTAEELLKFNDFTHKMGEHGS